MLVYISEGGVSEACSCSVPASRQGTLWTFLARKVWSDLCQKRQPFGVSPDMSAPPKPSTIGNSCTGTMIFDTIMKLSGNRGFTVHKKQWFLIHKFAWFLNLKTFIQQVNTGTRWSLRKLRAKSKDIMHDMHKMTTRQNSKVEGSSERWPNRWPSDDHFLSLWVLTDTSPQRALKWLPCW